MYCVNIMIHSHLTNSAIRSIITYIISISICRCSLMVKFELPKLASRVQFPSPAPYKKQTVHPSVFLYITKWELNTRRKPYNRRGANLGVPYHRQTPRKPLSRCVARSAAPKAALIVGYSLHLLHTKNRRLSRLFFFI